MIRALIVDDSSVIRKSMRHMLEPYTDIHVVGEAADPYEAREMIHRLNPDVLTLDLEMPRMDGLTFLAKLMKHHPLPVVVFSSHTQHAVRALALGAMEIVAKPRADLPVNVVVKLIVRAIRSAAACATPTKRTEPHVETIAPAISDTELLERTIIAIGASTGGPRAVQTVLEALPARFPGIVIAQHMPRGFTAAFANWLDKICALDVREAVDGQPILPGSVLIAPGGFQMRVSGHGLRYAVRVEDGPAVHFQRPSVDVLFQSVARNVGGDAIGVLLTGMGRDGAQGLKEMRERGARTLAQNEATCAVFGMPKEAIDIDAVDEVLPLDSIPGALQSAVLRERPFDRDASPPVTSQAGIEG